MLLVPLAKTLSFALLLCLPIAPQTPDKTVVTGDEHILLCHADFLRFYRVRVIERNQGGTERKSWTGWRLINDRTPDEKEDYQANLKFYRENKIEVQFAAVEAKLPE